MCAEEIRTNCRIPATVWGPASNPPPNRKARQSGLEDRSANEFVNPPLSACSRGGGV